MSANSEKIYYNEGYLRIENPFVSAIVPVYNEERCVKDCILSLKSQTILVEIIIVDDGSTDRTVAVAQVLGVRVLRQTHKGPGAARNLGAHNAKGNILVLVDADMTFASDYVERLIEPIVNGESIATCHWNERVSNWENPWARCQTWFLGLPDRKRHPAEVPPYEEIYRAVRRDFFIESKGFSENQGRGDDSSIARHTGVFSKIVPHAICFHNNFETPKEVLTDAIWHGRNISVSKIGRFRTFLSLILLHENPILEILRGFLMSVLKKEPRLIPYSVIYTFGHVFGAFHAMLRNYYLK